MHNTEPVAETSPAEENALYRKVAWRLLPLLLVCYVVAYLDRVNVGFAKLQMASDLGFSDVTYGLGAGIFFIGYFLFEVPSNIILHRVGARLWIGRIMITWGLVSAAMMYLNSPLMFYGMRFLLGVAEAGFFPGVILYLTYWFPSERRARVTAMFMTGVALAGVIGGPLSGAIMQLADGYNGWAGWQWMFLLEGLPAVFLGLLVMFRMDDRISDARWLNESERALLTERIASETASKSEESVFAALSRGRVWLLALIYFCLGAGLYGVSFWLPTIIKNMGMANPLQVGLVSAIPYGVAAVCMLLVSRSADRQRERRWHVVIPSLLAAMGLILSVQWSHNTVLAMAALTLATAGILTTLPLFWSLPTAFLAGTGAAAGIAMINSLGNLAGFASPYAIGWLKQATSSTDAGIYVLAGCLFLAALLTLCVPARLVNR